MKSLILSFIIILFSFTNTIVAQDDVKDKGEFIEYQNDFLDYIMEESGIIDSSDKETDKVFKLDLTGYDLPTSVSEFTSY